MHIMSLPDHPRSPRIDSSDHPGMIALRSDLSRHVRNEESAFTPIKKIPDTLMGHLERVAAFAVRLAKAEHVDPLLAEIAGLFHDAGKFHRGTYHEGDIPEEERSIDVLRDLATKNGFESDIIEPVMTAIRQLYRDDPVPTPLSQILFDADNLDKLGLLGIANYFVKSGLRGQGISDSMIIRLTVELNYARYASKGLHTPTARNIAEQRASDTIQFIHRLLASLKEDGLLDTRVETVQVDGFELEYITPAACWCGAQMRNHAWIEKGVKCTEIHLQIACTSCDRWYKLRFCKPRLIA